MSLPRHLEPLVLAALFLALPTGAAALDAGPNDLYVRVVDVGPGLCVVARIPGGMHLVYDAGHWQGKHCLEGVRAVVTGGQIALMVLSHSDGGHIGNVPDILQAYRVRAIVRAGEPRFTTPIWRAANDAIAEAVKHGTTVINFLTAPIAPGTVFHLGDATLTFVPGWTELTERGPTASERLNAASIIAKLTYRGRSILLTGNPVGRPRGDPDSACTEAEAVMVQRHLAGTLKADVIVARHHGGDNGSARCLIQAVDPTFVILSAGPRREHPTRGAAPRDRDRGVPEANIFRTNRADEELGTFEGKGGSITGCRDPRGDDDVEIVVRDNATMEVAYRTSDGGC